MADKPIMTLKEATLLAVVSLILQIIVSIGYQLRLEYYTVLSILGIISNVGLLPFFIIIFQRQKDGN